MVSVNGLRPHDGVLLTRDQPTSATLAAGVRTAAKWAFSRAAGICVAPALVLAAALASAASPSSPSRPPNPLPAAGSMPHHSSWPAKPAASVLHHPTAQRRPARHLERDPLR